MGAIVYTLCALTSLACAILLFRGYKQNKYRLLLWSSIGFFGFFMNNTLLYVDLVMLPSTIDLSIVRTIPALIGMIVLVYGLITDEI